MITKTLFAPALSLLAVVACGGSSETEDSAGTSADFSAVQPAAKPVERGLPCGTAGVGSDGADWRSCADGLECQAVSDTTDHTMRCMPLDLAERGAVCGSMTADEPGSGLLNIILSNCVQGLTCQEIRDDVMRCLPPDAAQPGEACGTVAGGQNGNDLILSNCPDDFRCLASSDPTDPTMTCQ
jgi:hypothetical protein